MIHSFGDEGTEGLFHGDKSAMRKYPSNILRAAQRKLDRLNRAVVLDDMRFPSGNRLELLQGDWAGFHSIRVNDQWRLVFRWTGKDAAEVRLTDYH